MSRLAWVTSERQIATALTEGGRAELLTGPWPIGGGGWSTLARAQVTWSWPTWSPDGQWVAAFAVEGSDDRTGPVRVVASSIDGVHQAQWLEAPGVAPIYLRWSPSGRALAVLVQRGNRLALDAISADNLGRARAVAEGVPLFFAWTPSGEQLVVHAAEGPGKPGTLVRRDPFGKDEDRVFTAAPGSFCAPVLCGDTLIWAGAEEGPGSRVIASATDGSAARALVHRRGLLALVASPDGKRLAVSHAPKGDGSAYAGIDVVDVATGSAHAACTFDCLAFFWSPSGDWLLAAEVVSAENCLRWWRVPADGGEAVPLGTFWPTKDVQFFLRFFDQYTASHPLVSADGRYVTFAGYPAGNGVADLSRPPRVYLREVARPEAPLDEIDGGSFAVFSS